MSGELRDVEMSRCRDVGGTLGEPWENVLKDFLRDVGGTFDIDIDVEDVGGTVGL